MMNIETLLQAAQILESQQSIPPKKRLARGDRHTQSPHHVPPTVLSPTTVNTTTVPSFPSLIKNERLEEFPQLDLNLNFHHHSHLAQQQQQQQQQQQHSRSSQQRFSSDQNDDDDDGQEDDTNSQHADGNSDLSNRVQTCFRDREIHNRLEKHRRAHLKDCFDNLKAEVPCQRDRKITNLQVLNLAIKYIQTLTRKEREYEHETAMLAARNLELQRRLGSLKTELNSDGHDVDTWLDSCSDIDRSTSTMTASEAEMYRTFDDDDELDSSLQVIKTKTTTNGIHDDSTSLDTNNNLHHQTKQNVATSYALDQRTLSNSNRKAATTTRPRPRPSKRKLLTTPPSITTTNLLRTLSTSTPNTSSRSDNLLDYTVARHLRLDEPCNLLTAVTAAAAAAAASVLPKDISSSSSSTTTMTPITDIRYEIVDLFTKGTMSQQHHQQQQQQQQISPLPSIASLMNRHSSQPSPVVSPTKQTIGINTDPLTTSTTNILHQPVATS